MHYSVLLNESIEGLNIKSDGIYVDCTLGYGGHSSVILSKLTTGKLYCFDQDEEAIKYSKERLSKIGNNYQIIYSNFSNLKEKLNEIGVDKVDGILFDLGFSSPQVDDESRGFSFMKDAPLDMRMDTNQEFSAKDVVNDYSEDKLRQVFYKYGEEKFSNSIAHNIINSRPISSTMELVKIIEKSVPYKYFKEHHPERKIFQAIRIEVNHELDVLESVLPDAVSLLKVGGRISVITFHSLEDRIVKQTFKNMSEVSPIFSGLRESDIPEEFKPTIKLINKKPILPSEKELNENSRSASAKLRVIERV